MKRSILAVIMLVCVLLSACAGSKAEVDSSVTRSYEGLREEVRDADAVATIFYEWAAQEHTPTHVLNKDPYANSVLIVPRIVGSKIMVAKIRADGPEEWSVIQRTCMEVVAQENTLLQLSLSEVTNSYEMWYVEVTLPDGSSYNSPIPFFCERQGADYLHVGKHWKGEDRLPLDWEEEIVTTAKPVLYLYPREECRVDVDLDYRGELTCTYPKYEGGWSVTARPDGTLTDDRGQEYNYLYWEGVGYKDFDFSRGFCVTGEDTAAFLEEALEKLGLTRREANEFIVYWLPLMEGNSYNVIAFQTETYEEAAKLTVSPQPDTVIRVFMAWYGTDRPVELPAQELTAPLREGFTVVEWGGSQAIGH